MSGKEPKIIKVGYGRKFSSENLKPERQLTKYEPEEVWLEAETNGMAPEEAVKHLHNKAIDCKKALDEQREKYKDVSLLRNTVSTLKGELENLEAEMVNTPTKAQLDRVKRDLKQSQEELDKTMKELGLTEQE